MIKVYGYSDDLLCIDGHDEGEIDCYDKVVRIAFDDGTVIWCRYGKPDLAVWQIEVEAYGSARRSLELCTDENAEVYSDIFTIDAKVASVTLHGREEGHAGDVR